VLETILYLKQCTEFVLYIESILLLNYFHHFTSSFYKAILILDFKAAHFNTLISNDNQFVTF